MARTSAAPSRATVGGSSGCSPALPRTPSVPNNFDIASAWLLDRDLDDGGCGRADAEVLRRVELDSQIVRAGSKPGKIDEGIDGLGPHLLDCFATATHGHPHDSWRDTRAVAGAEVAPADRDFSQLTLDRRREDLHRHRRT